jgi:hypothetical protein
MGWVSLQVVSSFKSDTGKITEETLKAKKKAHSIGDHRNLKETILLKTKYLCVVNHFKPQ